jgi:hypothetical protein
MIHAADLVPIHQLLRVLYTSFGPRLAAKPLRFACSAHRKKPAATMASRLWNS